MKASSLLALLTVGFVSARNPAPAQLVMPCSTRTVLVPERNLSRPVWTFER
ncbi:hypothetical protein [Aureimonas sp. ME7]|uniref:hypothetical protein n=1 Tax=Aureimonas sp. ME7 TaxID=2744252 RepID=UPI0015F42D2C|nr:hypothetical protein [Aureimonas sp. ME7]